MKKLLKKQGFTLVELIVVIAIMAILLAMLVPSLSNQQSFEQEVRENARAFYSNVQGLMVDEKLRDVKDFTQKEYSLIYAHVELPTATAKTDVSVYFGDNIGELKAKTLKKEHIDTESKGDTLYEFANSLNKLLMTSDHEGYYYAIVDNQYRVVYTYYTRNVDLDTLIDTKTEHAGDYRVRDDSGTENYLGAYPYNMNFRNDLFPDPNDIAPHAKVTKVS